MEVNFAFLCDYADQSGAKMTAIGIGFDTIYATRVPAVHALFFSVISLKSRSGSPYLRIRKSIMVLYLMVNL